MQILKITEHGIYRGPSHKKQNKIMQIGSSVYAKCVSNQQNIALRIVLGSQLKRYGSTW